MSLDINKVEAALRTVNPDYYDGFTALAYEDFDAESVNIDGVDYPIKVVETDPGGEGHGEYVYFVVKVGDEFFRKEGYYASHHGTDWDGDFEKVSQVEKTVKVWEAV